MSELIAIPIQGCKAVAVIPTEYDSAAGKYKLPTTIKSYYFDTIGDGTIVKMPKPADSSGKDTFLSYETTSAQTVQVQIYPTTLTLKDSGFETKTGEAADPVYPEITIATGNAPKLKSGATAAARISVKEYAQLKLDLQKVPSIIVTDMGVEVGETTSIGAYYAVGTLSDVTYAPKGKSFEGDTLVFAGKSISVDITALEAITITPLEQTAITFPALTQADITAIAGGALLIK